jgi:hypothetical protein
MRAKYVAPSRDAKQFHCPHCGVYASQLWYGLMINYPSTWGNTGFSCSSCVHCSRLAFWHLAQIIVPSDAPVEPPHPDLPEDLKPDFEEARSIVGRSPRSAAALLRLLIQKLMPHLGQSGTNINADIKSLVAAGLPATAQKALDYCRVVGNNAVHPGEIDLTDTPEVANQLFAMVNFIVDDRITRPKEIADLYQTLPQAARDAIDKRDASGS